ncbi:hypothetical protein [Actinomyces naeslundii]|uniref:hypothetical protein n=1 Tax=Actinomyces naeslundii TaxID=1655 RepID=UPI000AE4620C|nr:hypothetical protein [Actinomyces naeslundii]
MSDRFDKQFALFATTVIVACILKLGALVAIELGYSTVGPWMDDIGSIVIAALLVSGIRSITRNFHRRKWKAVPARIKITLIAYYIVVIAGTIASILGYAARLLSSVTLLLSAIFFTMFAMASFTPQTDVDYDGNVQK